MTTRPRHTSKRSFYGFLALLVIVVYAGWSLFRPLPALHPEIAHADLQVTTPTATLTWPNTQAAVGLAGTSIMETHGAQTPRPTASTAKIITALTVLQAKPLKPGQQGPTITLTDKDVATYQSYVARDGSVLPVEAGEEISEYQMLQAMMLPSANNIADTMAIWAYGSFKNYQRAATAFLRHQGLTHTHIGSDASGLSPDTTSTAGDLVRLGELAMQHPVLSAIVGQQTATNIPDVGDIENVNTLLGQNGIIGVKTGNSDQAGGVFVGAAATRVNGRPVTIVTAVVGTPDLASALRATTPLVTSAQANFAETSVLTKGTIIGRYAVPGREAIQAVAAEDLNVTVWRGATVSTRVALHPTAANSRAGTAVGSVSAASSRLDSTATVPVVLGTNAPKPPLAWRLTHPL